MGRYANGQRASTVDAGVGGVRSSGWDFDSAGHPWGALYRTDTAMNPLGVFVIRLD